MIWGKKGQGNDEYQMTIDLKRSKGCQNCIVKTIFPFSS